MSQQPLDKTQVEIYQKREKIYPRQVHGLFANLRVSAVLVLLGLYYGIPWLQWGGQQAVLFDLPARKFYIFGLTFWPQDFFYLAVLLMIAALSLFFFTALAGRLWCGYACPQTVWTETFLWMERLVEGTRNQQMKRDKAGKNFTWYRLKLTKHSLWLLFSLFTGFTFVGYFMPIAELAQDMISLELGAWAWFWVLFYGFATYGNAGWMREQVCIYMCPYARFQSAMFDDDTLIISYDEKRGDPRGARRKTADPKTTGLGDCVDCGLCKQVCPTGIDIRDGLQYQCIGCAACIDVCDDVMDKMGYDKGLVKYTTENARLGKALHIIRPRMFVYAALLVALSAGLFYSIATRLPLELDIIRDRNALYRETNEGLVENVYTLKLINMDNQDHAYVISVSGIDGMQLFTAKEAYPVASGEVVSAIVQVQIDPEDLPKTANEIFFTAEAVNDPNLTTTQTARFVGPIRR